MVEYRQERIPESDYHKALNAEEGEQENPHAETGEQSHAADTLKGNVRYWSDFSRVDFHPRSLQKLPDLPEWKSSAGDWNLGKEIFKQHDKVQSSQSGHVSVQQTNQSPLTGHKPDGGVVPALY